MATFSMEQPRPLNWLSYEIGPLPHQHLDALLDILTARILHFADITRTVLCLSSFVTCLKAIALPDESAVLEKRRHGKLAPKVFILNAFTPEAESFYAVKNFNLLGQNITIPGLSPKFPQAHCTTNGEICQVTVGEGEINAASSFSALLISQFFDLTKTYFLVAGIAGIAPDQGTIGSVTFARFSVQVALQYEFDIRDIGDDFSTGYIPFGTKKPGEYPTAIYGTEVFEVNAALRSKAIAFAKKVKLQDSPTAVKFRKLYPHRPANRPPALVACDGATSDVYYTGPTLSSSFEKHVSILTNGTGHYCATAQEDNAILTAFLRSAKAGIVDFARIIVMRSAANFDRPPPRLSPYEFFFDTTSGGFLPSLHNLAAVGVPIVEGIVKNWASTYHKGIKPTNYIGDIFGSLGGVPEFGPYPYFGEA